MVAFGLEGLQVEVVDGDKLDPGWSLVDQQFRVLGQDGYNVGTFHGKLGNGLIKFLSEIYNIFFTCIE